MFTALGSPKGASIGLSAAALIIAVSYSLYAAPMRVTVDVARPVPVQPTVDPPIHRPPRHRGRRVDRCGTRAGAGSVSLTEPAPPEEILS